MTVGHTILLAAVCAGAVGLIVGATGHHHKRCTHGASSIGPVRIVNGHVTGDTTPHTEVCIP